MRERSSDVRSMVEPTKEHEPKRRIEIQERSLVLLVGLPGSGKSTFAANHFPLDSIISTDSIRREIANNPKNQLVSDHAFAFAQRLVQERLRHGEFAVIDALNLTELSRKRFLDIAREQHVPVHVLALDIEAEKAIQRDAGRTKHVGEKIIRERSQHFSQSLRMLRKYGPHKTFDVVKHDEIETLDIVLPDVARERFKEDQEFLQDAERAGYLLMLTESGFLKREYAPTEKRFELPSGGVLFIGDSSEARALLQKSVLPHQVIDSQNLANRLATDVSDEAVRDTMQYLLQQRMRLNLTTVVLDQPDSVFRSTLSATIAEEAKRRSLNFPMVELSQNQLKEVDRIVVTRDAQDDAPLLLIGDVQGAYRAMRELTGQVRKENLAHTTVQNRQIVFVGDMADRGPMDAEAVIYICALVRSGRATLIRGNHDQNLLEALEGKRVASSETRQTAQDLTARLKPASIERIKEVIRQAPLYQQWQGLIAVHGSLPRVPRHGEVPDAQMSGYMLYGKQTGRFHAGRREVHHLADTVAHDPDQLVVGGHTHEGPPSLDVLAGSVNLDASVEQEGRLYGMYYPELTFTNVGEPEVLSMNEVLRSGELPQGGALLRLVEFARQQGMVKTKQGAGDHEGLTIVSYTPITELENLWQAYPTLRHFRGLIMDQAGKIVARPFKKTHKAGVEIPLKDLEITPTRVFEKVNGTLIVFYNHHGHWRTSTKFSFENDEYTRVADRLLNEADSGDLDPQKTYLFEILLPNDPHIVNYEGEEALVLLNAIHNETGATTPWDEIQAQAQQLGMRTADEMTEAFKRRTVADIYRHAQTPGNLKNIEGLMAIYQKPDGESVMIKIKAREYDEKKFIRDRLDWKTIFEKLDERLQITERAKDELLLYQFDNPFVVSVLETRLEWVQSEVHRIVSEITTILLSPMTRAHELYERELNEHGNHQRALGASMRTAAREIQSVIARREDFDQDSMGSFMAFLRKILSSEASPEQALYSFARRLIQQGIEEETKKRGDAAFWLLPQ